MMMTEFVPCAVAAIATPCAWLPDENAITPCARTDAGSADTAAQAPRALNDPVICRHSALIHTLRPAMASSAGEDSRGVRRTCPARRMAAASIIAMLVMAALLTAQVINRPFTPMRKT